MPHHIRHPQSGRPSFAYFLVLRRRKNRSETLSASMVHIIVPPQNDASKSPCRRGVLSHYYKYHYRDSVQERDVRRPSSLLRHDRIGLGVKHLLCDPIQRLCDSHIMNTNSPSKDRKNVQYQSPGKLLITIQAAGYISATTAVFNSRDN